MSLRVEKPVSYRSPNRVIEIYLRISTVIITAVNSQSSSPNSSLMHKDRAQDIIKAECYLVWR